jgi:hypothetical protein
MCVLVAGEAAPAALRTISATGAFLETNLRLEPGSGVELHHPEAGVIDGIVDAITRDGIRLTFVCTEHSVAFALSAITADMSKPV